MKKDIERLLADACADQRADLEAFAETGNEDALARIHFDECSDCDRTVEKIIELRDGLPPAPAIVQAPKPGLFPTWESKAWAGGVAACVLVFFGFMAHMIYDCLRWKSVDERYGDVASGLSFVKDDRSGVCFLHADGEGRSFAQVDCAAVADRAGRDEDFTGRIWYFKDTREGLCFAWWGYRGLGATTPVACAPSVLKLLTAHSESGRFLIEPGR